MKALVVLCLTLTFLKCIQRLAVVSEFLQLQSRAGNEVARVKRLDRPDPPKRTLRWFCLEFEDWSDNKAKTTLPGIG